jgi:hypothetical protein
MTLWAKACTSDRKLAFGFDGKSEDPNPFSRVLPQGSPIPLILFTIRDCTIFETQTHDIQITQKQDKINVIC